MVAGRRLNTPPPGSAAGQGTLATLKALPDIFQYTRHALGLVWATSRRLTVALALLTLLAGLLPAGIAYVGALIVDAVVAAIAAGHGSGGVDLSQVLGYVASRGRPGRGARRRRSAGFPPASRCCAPSSASASTR